MVWALFGLMAAGMVGLSAVEWLRAALASAVSV